MRCKKTPPETACILNLVLWFEISDVPVSIYRPVHEQGGYKAVTSRPGGWKDVYNKIAPGMPEIDHAPIRLKAYYSLSLMHFEPKAVEDDLSPKGSLSSPSLQLMSFGSRKCLQVDLLPGMPVIDPQLCEASTSFSMSVVQVTLKHIPRMHTFPRACDTIDLSSDVSPTDVIIIPAQNLLLIFLPRRQVSSGDQRAAKFVTGTVVGYKYGTLSRIERGLLQQLHGESTDASQLSGISFPYLHGANIGGDLSFECLIRQGKQHLTVRKPKGYNGVPEACDIQWAAANGYVTTTSDALSVKRRKLRSDDARAFGSSDERLLHSEDRIDMLTDFILFDALSGRVVSIDGLKDTVVSACGYCRVSCRERYGMCDKPLFIPRVDEWSVQFSGPASLWIKGADDGNWYLISNPLPSYAPVHRRVDQMFRWHCAFEDFLCLTEQGSGVFLPEARDWTMEKFTARARERYGVSLTWLLDAEISTWLWTKIHENVDDVHPTQHWTCDNSPFPRAIVDLFRALHDPQRLVQYAGDSDILDAIPHESRALHRVLLQNRHREFHFDEMKLSMDQMRVRSITELLEFTTAVTAAKDQPCTHVPDWRHIQERRYPED